MNASHLEILGVSMQYFPTGATWDTGGLFPEETVSRESAAEGLMRFCDQFHSQSADMLTKCIELVGKHQIRVLSPFALFDFVSIAQGVGDGGMLSWGLSDIGIDDVIGIEDREALYVIGLGILEPMAQSGQVEFCHFVTVWECEAQHYSSIEYGDDYDYSFALLGRMDMENEPAIRATLVDAPEETE